jgi:pSer/pThr/pTyr-binding forkhead associated (FHA) protein
MHPISRAEMRIFVSHSKFDTEFGLRLTQDLRSMLGSEDAVWFDVAGGLQGGAAWWRTIVQEITARPVFLIILSPDAMASDWVRDEIDLAWNQKNALGKLIMPVLYRDCVIREDLRTRQYIPFSDESLYEESFKQLLAALGLPTDVVDVFPTLTLTALSGTELPIQAQPQKAVINIGRERDNDVIVEDPSVSRHHLSLTRHGVTWHVSRLPNSGPLYVNGAQRDEADLRPNDQMALGGTLIRFETPTQLVGAQRGDLATPRLLLEIGPYQFGAPLREATITIGRAPQSNIIVPSPVVGRHHATLQRTHDGVYVIEDAGSQNGLYVQGRRVKSHQLRQGETVTLGDPARGAYVALTFLAGRP